MSIINSQPLIGASGQQGYTIAKSLRFRSSASAYLNRTPASAGNRRTWTWSGWVKRGALNTYQRMFEARNSSGDSFIFNDTDTLNFWLNDASSANLTTTQVFRDPSAWYHLVLAVDTTQATSSNRIKMYVNGTQITSFSSATYPLQNYDCHVNNTVVHNMGRHISAAIQYFDGYLAEVNFIDGQALTPSSFGETSASTGVWIPKKYSGTYGTNGFYLDFKDTSSVAALGYDAAGSNDWTVNNVSLTSGSTYDSMTDVPTLTSATAANYAVMNPLDKDISRGTVDNGNLRLTYASFNSLNAAAVRSTLGTSTGKWYFECVNQTWNGGGNSGYMTITSNTGSLTGVSALAGSLTNFIGVDATVFSNAVTFRTNGLSASLATGTTLFASYASGDVINFAFDLDAGKIWIGKNGTWYNSGNPSAGTNQTSTFTAGGVTFFSEFEAITSSDNSNQSSILPNFGQRPFSYTPPSGFVALNTFNLPTPTIGATASTQAGKYFGINLWTGNGSTGSRAITGLGFKPDWVWWKNRTTAKWHQVFDSNRGADKALSTNATDAEDASGGYGGEGSVTSFDTDGYTLQGGVGNNENGSAIVGWAWQAGQGTNVTNTAGSITSTVSANTTAGFSIVTYTGTGTNATVGHGLGVAPSMVIVKSRTGGTLNWAVYHTSLGTNNTVFLDSTSGSVSSTQYWNTAPTSSVFGIGTANLTNTNASNFVAYCFAQVAGYSAFGSYTGNGSSDGTFVYTGFRPKFIICKRTDSTGFWTMLDSSRSTFNVIDDALYANASNAESTPAQNVDFLSNGFKFRSTDSDTNSNGGTHVYMAFAENPFKYSLAR